MFYNSNSKIKIGDKEYMNSAARLQYLEDHCEDLNPSTGQVTWGNVISVSGSGSVAETDLCTLEIDDVAYTQGVFKGSSFVSSGDVVKLSNVSDSVVRFTYYASQGYVSNDLNPGTDVNIDLRDGPAYIAELQVH